MGWEVWLDGDDVDLNLIAESFKHSNLLISKSDGSYVLTSTEFGDSDSYALVKEKASKFLDVLNGATYLLLDAHRPIRIDGFYFRNADGTTKAYLSGNATLRMRAIARSVTLKYKDGSETILHAGDPIHDVVKLAVKDQAVSTVLKLLNSGDWGWVNMYRIYEIVTADCGGLNVLVANGWATGKTLSLFRRTANHPDAAGIDARHGLSSDEPPLKPMTLVDGRALIQSVVRAWLQTKLTRS